MTREERALARAQRIANQRPGLTLARAVPAKPAFIAAVPKDKTPRNAAVLDMAEGRRCLLRVPGVCTDDRATTVACHRNEGKGMGLKQSDAYCVWGCAACHRWYDRSAAPREAKRARFMLAHADQVIEWSRVMNDPSEPERLRRAARWALESLSSTLLDAVDAAERAVL